MLLQVINSLSRTRKRALIVAMDLAMIPVAFAFCYGVQSLGVTASDFSGPIIAILPYLMAAAIGVSFWFEVPQVRLKNFEGRAVTRYAAYASVVALLVLPMGSVAGLSVPASTYVLFGLSYFCLGTVMRFAMRGVLIELYSRSIPRSRVVIYGAGATGSELASALREHRSIDPVAFIDDNPSLQGLIIHGLPVFSPSRLPDIIEERAVDRVLIAMPSQSAPKQMQVARGMQDLGVEVQVLPSFSQLIGEETLLDKFVSLPPKRLLGRTEVETPLGESAKCYSGKSVLISGAGGSIGSELSRQMIECKPKRIVLFELSEFALYTVDNELRPLAEANGIELVVVLGSVTDGSLVRRVLEDNAVQVVIHAAAYKHVPIVEANPLAGLANNVFGTQTLAREAVEADIERFILISSDKAVRPANIMGASKRFSEMLLQDLASRVPTGTGPRFSMVRFGNVLGSSGSVVPLFQDQISRGGPVTVTHSNVTRYFMTVHEATQLVLTAGAMAEGGEIYVLDMGKPVSILSLARQTIEASGYSVRDSGNPDGDIEIKVTGLRPGEKMHEELSLKSALMKTVHQKIFETSEDALSQIDVARTVRDLREAVENQDVEGAREVISQAVREYKPQGVPEQAKTGA